MNKKLLLRYILMTLVIFLLTLLSYEKDDLSNNFSQNAPLKKLFVTNKKVNNSLKYGLINEKGGQVVSPKFDDICDFSESLIAIKLNGKWGFIDRHGMMKVKPQFYEKPSFIDGLSVLKNNKFEVLENVSFFKDGLASVKCNGKYGFINKKGEFVISPKFDSVGIFNDGVCSIYENKKFIFIDKKGKPITDEKFDFALDFSNGLAKVYKKDFGWYYINKKGELVCRISSPF